MVLNFKSFNSNSSKKKSSEDSLNFKHVDLYYWKPKQGGLNFGDYLSKVIVTKILAEEGHLLEEETKTQKRLLSIGSILHFAQNNDVIWGSGINGKISLDNLKFHHLDVRSVRGPLTRSILIKKGINTPEVYGDPALLTPHLFPGRFKREYKKQYVVVPNIHDLTIAEEKKWKNVISPFTVWNKCISQILQANFVIASSLHGLIIAEAYGIPARYVRISETENLFKYNDYMMGTGRGEIEYARDIEEAIEMGGMKPPVFDTQRLLKAFPIDLWK